MQAAHLESLGRHAMRVREHHLRELLAEPGRFERFSRRAGPLLLDLSKQRLDERALGALGGVVEDIGWSAARDAMFAGAILNASEHRAVLHTALRASEPKLPPLAPPDVRAEID